MEEPQAEAKPARRRASTTRRSTRKKAEPEGGTPRCRRNNDKITPTWVKVGVIFLLAG